MSSTQVRRNGPYAPLGANYADDEAIATLDLDEDDRAELLYVRGLAYCARDPRTEGYISDVALRTAKVLRRKTGKKNADTIAIAATRLAELGLWTREGDGYRITAWLKWNKSWDEITLKRGKDAARKAGESDGNTDGSDMDSARSPNGVAAPRHGTSAARHVTADHGSSTPPPTAEPRSGGTAIDLLREHQTEHGPLPRITADQLTVHTDTALAAGASPAHVLAGLEEWRRRPAVKPGLLPHLIADAQQADGATGAADAEVQAWVAEQQAKRAAGATR